MTGSTFCQAMRDLNLVPPALCIVVSILSLFVYYYYYSLISTLTWSPSSALPSASASGDLNCIRVIYKQPSHPLSPLPLHLPHFELDRHPCKHQSKRVTSPSILTLPPSY
jgi:hypothetical protein